MNVDEVMAILDERAAILRGRGDQVEAAAIEDAVEYLRYRRATSDCASGTGASDPRLVPTAADDGGAR